MKQMFSFFLVDLIIYSFLTHLFRLNHHGILVHENMRFTRVYCTCSRSTKCVFASRNNYGGNSSPLSSFLYFSTSSTFCVLPWWSKSKSYLFTNRDRALTNENCPVSSQIYWLMALTHWARWMMCDERCAMRSWKFIFVCSYWRRAICTYIYNLHNFI